MSYQQIDDHDLLRRILEATVRLGHGRDALLLGIAPEVSMSLPTGRTRADALWSDLNQLNQLGRLMDGTVPLEIWLKNARMLSGPRAEARVFQEALDRLATKQEGDPPRSDREPTHRGGLEVLSHGGHRVTSPRVDPDGLRGGHPSVVAWSGGSSSAARPWGVHPVDRAAPEVVVLHATEDESYARALETHTVVIKNAMRARFGFEWSLDPTAPRDSQLRSRVNRASLVLVLLSSAFIASDTMALVEQALSEGKRIVPILVRACDWKSTQLGRLTPLPRTGLPIAQHSNADEAYAKITGEVRELLERIKDTPAPPIVQPDQRPPVASGRPLTVGEVFPDHSPEVTYVEPAEQADLLAALAKPDRGLVVEGPSAIGKTTAIARALAQLKLDFVHLVPGDPEIDRLQRPDDVNGWVVIDDFHQLDEPRKKQLAQLLKWMTDRPARNRKVVLVGVGEVARTVIALNTNLLRRFDRVRIQRQPDAKVEELLRKGEEALHVRFEPRSVLTVLANGSFALAQQLGAQAARDAGVTTTQPISRRIEVSHGKLVDELLGQLRLAYEDELARLIQSDRDMPGPRGVYLALLWLLSQKGDAALPLSDVTNAYPQFSRAVEQARPEGVVAPLLSGTLLPECLRVDGQRITVADPRLSFYLQNESFAALARAGRLGDTAWITEEGVLEYRGPGHEVLPPAAVATLPMWTVRDADLFWPRSDVRALLKLMSSAYGHEIRNLLAVAQVAGVPPAEVAFQGRAGADVARDVLDHARQRGVVKALLDELRRDDRIRAYWPDLDEMLAPQAARAAG